MQTKLLSEAEFKTALGEQMINITGKEDTASPAGVLDVIPYVDAVPQSDLNPHTLHDHFVEYVYRSSDNRFDHVLFMTKTKNVYLVVVVDLKKDQIKGHHILDLNKLYAITEQVNEGDGE